MPWWGTALVFFGAFILFSVLHFYSKKKHPAKRALLSMLIGILTLIAVDLCSSFTGVYIPISLLSVLISTIGGVPGVTLILILNMFF